MQVHQLQAIRSTERMRIFTNAKCSPIAKAVARDSGVYVVEKIVTHSSPTTSV